MQIEVKQETDGFPCAMCKRKLAARVIRFSNDKNKILFNAWLCVECMREVAQKFRPYT